MKRDDNSIGCNENVDTSRRTAALAMLTGVAGTAVLQACVADVDEQEEPTPLEIGRSAQALSVSLLAFDRVADLTTHPGSASSPIALIAGYAAAGDGGGGIFCWDAASTDPQDDGTIFGSGAAGRWKRATPGAMNVRWFGAVGDGIAPDDSAFSRALQAAANATGCVYVPAGHYLVNKITELRGGFTFYGDGPECSIIEGDTSVDHVIEVTGQSLNRLTIRDLTITGRYDFDPNPSSPAPAFHGIFLHNNNFALQVNLSNLHIRSCAGSAIREADSVFSSLIQNVTVDGCMGHAIDLQGGSCTTLLNCFVQDISANRIAYRIASGTPIMIGCNGVTNNTGLAQNTIWGDFENCRPTLIGCNIESFSKIGCRFGVGDSFGNFIGTSIVHNVNAQAVALRYAHIAHDEHFGLWDGTSVIYPPTNGGSWGRPMSSNTQWGIEARGNPFLTLSKQTAQFSIYNHENDLVSSMPYLASAYSSYLNYALRLSRAVIDATS